MHFYFFQRQGSRTPHTDALARGSFVGLSLSHTRAHLFRAILESVCYGTRACFDALEAAAQQGSNKAMSKSNEVIIAGGELMQLVNVRNCFINLNALFS